MGNLGETCKTLDPDMRKICASGPKEAPRWAPEWESRFFMVTTKGNELCTTCGPRSKGLNQHHGKKDDDMLQLQIIETDDG